MVPCDDLDGWDGGLVGGRLKKEGIYVYMHMADSHCCTAVILQFKNKLIN